MRCAVLALFVLAGVSSEAETIDFDNLPGVLYWAGTFIPEASRLSNQLAHLGVSFSSTAPYCAVVNLENTAPSFPNGIAGASAQDLVSYNQANPVVITFCPPGHPELQGNTDYVRVVGNRGHAGPEVVARMRAFDIDGQLVATGYMPDDGLHDLSVTTATHIIHRVIIDRLGPGEEPGIGLDNLVFTTPTAYRELSGRVVFRSLDFGATPPATALLEFRESGTLIVLATVVAALSPSGEFSIVSPVEPGPVGLSVKHSHWLRRTIAVDTTNGGVSGLVFTLRNGDCDGDNEISIGDFSAISLAYNSNPGAGNWNAMADINRDLEVDIVDYAIMSQGYGLFGDD